MRRTGRSPSQGASLVNVEHQELGFVVEMLASSGSRDPCFLRTLQGTRQEEHFLGGSDTIVINSTAFVPDYGG